MKLTNGKIAILVIFLVLFIDQFTKIWVKTHMYLGQDIEITKWFDASQFQGFRPMASSQEV